MPDLLEKRCMIQYIKHMQNAIDQKAQFPARDPKLSIKHFPAIVSVQNTERESRRSSF